MKTYNFLLAICFLAMSEMCYADEVFHVSTQPPKGQIGNMHYSEVMRLQLGDSRPVLLRTELERGVFAPSDVLLTKKIRKNEIVVFAYSSSGGGSETLHAILLSRAGEASVVTDHLKMNVRRGTGGFLWTEGGELYVVQPATSLDDSLFLQSNHLALSYSQMNELKFTSSPKDAVLVAGLFRDIAPAGSSSLKVAKIHFSDGHFDLP